MDNMPTSFQMPETMLSSLRKDPTGAKLRELFEALDEGQRSAQTFVPAFGTNRESAIQVAATITSVFEDARAVLQICANGRI